MKHRIEHWAAAFLFAAAMCAAFGQPAPRLEIPENADDQVLITRIRKLVEAELNVANAAPAQRQAWLTISREEAVRHADLLLEKYPSSPHREEAAALKLEALAQLARFDSKHLDQLLATTAKIAESQPSERLAAENAFYRIQAFVLGARREGMSEDRMRVGTAERYVAFLEDHPDSPRVPVIRASLIRTWLAMRRIDDAEEQLEILTKSFPEHEATRRAAGEVFRATAVGKKFPLPRSAEFRSHVLIVHYWASWSEATMQDLAKLRELHAAHREDGLRVLGINLDAGETRAREIGKERDISWPQIIEDAGFDGNTVIDTGVVRLPTYFVIDREGIVKAVSNEMDFEPLVRDLLRSE